MDHSHSSHEGNGQGSVGSYMAGFVLSVILTVAAFGLVMAGLLTGAGAMLAISGLAFVQIVVHLVYFLHMNTSSAQRWNITAFGFTAMTGLIVIGGTLWVMHNVNVNMMSR